MRKGSVLLTALFIVAVLALMVMSFCYEAHQQVGVNVHVRERNRLNHMVDSAQAILEVVLLNYTSVSDWSEDQKTEDLLEDNRWFLEEQELKMYGKCTVGPIVLEDPPEKGSREEEEGEEHSEATITIDIQSVNSGSKGLININKLNKDGEDSKYTERWAMIFTSHSIPEELSTPEDGTINLWNTLIASWDDWHDSDDTVTAMDGEECGAESQWYEEYEEEHDVPDEEKVRPRNGDIPDVKELVKLRGWREYPQVLTGGVINPWEKREEDQITVRGLLDLFSVEGSSKININDCDSLDALITVPGIYEDPDDSDAVTEARTVAQMILDGLKEMPSDYTVDETRDWWPYKDWNDLCERVDEDIGEEASNYLIYKLEDNTLFKVTMKLESMGIEKTIVVECYVKDSDIRYVKWQED